MVRFAEVLSGTARRRFNLFCWLVCAALIAATLVTVNDYLRQDVRPLEFVIMLGHSVIALLLAAGLTWLVEMLRRWGDGVWFGGTQ